MKRAALPLILLIGLLIVVASFVPREPEADRAWGAEATTYSPGPRGAKALFLLLGQIGLDAKRWRSPSYGELSKDTVLWVLTSEPFGRTERRELIRFLRKGGTVIAPPAALTDVLEDAQLGKPALQEKTGPLVTAWETSLELKDAPTAITGAAEPMETFATAASGVPVVAAWRVGEGRAVSLGVEQLTQNERIGRAGNGTFLARLALALGKKHVFDEYKVGFGEGGLVALLARVPYRWAIAQLLLVAVVGLLAFAGRRLPAEEPEPVQRRRTLEHVEAVARLWEQARDAGLPLGAILSAARERARLRLGGGGGDRPFLEWIERVRPELSPRARDVWEKAERLCEGPRPPVEDARLLAVDLRRLEKDGLGW